MVRTALVMVKSFPENIMVWFDRCRVVQRARESRERERELKSEEELDVEISEAHSLAVLYEMVSSGRDGGDRG